MCILFLCEAKDKKIFYFLILLLTLLNLLGRQMSSMGRNGPRLKKVKHSCPEN